MTVEEQKKRMIGQMALNAGLIEDPQLLEKLNDAVPLWVVLDLLLRWVDRTDTRDAPYD